jgi:hypothetical protein
MNCATFYHGHTWVLAPHEEKENDFEAISKDGISSQMILCLEMLNGTLLTIQADLLFQSQHA